MTILLYLELKHPIIPIHPIAQGGGHVVGRKGGEGVGRYIWIW